MCMYLLQERKGKKKEEKKRNKNELKFVDFRCGCHAFCHFYYKTSACCIRKATLVSSPNRNTYFMCLYIIAELPL